MARPLRVEPALVDNHEHLFVETPEANLSAGVAHLDRRYRLCPIVEALGYGSGGGMVMAVRRIQSGLPRRGRVPRRVQRS